MPACNNPSGSGTVLRRPVRPGPSALFAASAAGLLAVCLPAGPAVAAPSAPFGPSAGTSAENLSGTAAAGSAKDVLRIAASLKGKPYRWGGTGPDAFDCSGYVQYVFKKAGHKIPRNTGQQHAAVKKIPAAQVKPGDLLFSKKNGGISHVAIYAGGGKVWHAPKPGRTVRLEKISTAMTKNRAGGRIL